MQRIIGTEVEYGISSPSDPTGKHTIDIDGSPTRNEWFILVLLVLVLPVAAAVGWAVSRIVSVSPLPRLMTVSAPWTVMADLICAALVKP